MKNIVAVLGVTLLSVSAGVAQPFTVKVASIEERRVRHFKPSTQGLNDTTVKVRVDELDMKQVHYYGQWKIAEAIDDKGTNLMSGREEGFDFDTSDPAFPFELSLDNSEREATKIVRLRGQFTALVGGQPKVVSFSRLKSRIGTTLHDPTLRAAGLQIKVLPPEKPNKGALPTPRSFRLQVQGNRHSFDPNKGFVGVEIVDAAGRNVMDSGVGTERYTLTSVPDNTMTIRFHLLLNQKHTTILFDLHDIPLP